MLPDVNPLLSNNTATGADRLLLASLLQTGGGEEGCLFIYYLPTRCCDLLFSDPPAPEGKVKQRNC